jgi:hypothetical protein
MIGKQCIVYLKRCVNMRPWLIIMHLEEEAHKRHDKPQSNYKVFQLRFKQRTE